MEKKKKNFIPINIEIKENEFEITNKIKIIKLDNKTKEKLFKIDNFIIPSIIETKYENSLKLEYAFVGDDKSINYNHQNLILALRLVNNKKYFIPFSEISENSRGICMFNHYETGTNKKIKLETNHLNELKVVYNKIIEVKDVYEYEYFKERLIFIIRKFNSNSKLKLVDLVSLLEGMILQNDKENLSYKFSLYLFYILNKKIKNNNLKLTFNEIRDIYALRSKIAHSGYSKKDNKRYGKYTNSDYLNKLETIVFEIFKLYLFEKEFFDQSNLQSNILKDLEKGMK